MPTKIQLEASNTELSASVTELKAMVAALLDAQATAPVAPTVAAPAVKVTHLVKANRLAYIAAALTEGVDLTGTSTWGLALEAVRSGYSPAGWAIGPRYTAMAVEFIANGG